MTCVGIIGLGCVGNALLDSFRRHQIETKLYDKHKDLLNFEAVLDCTLLFLCLPTEFDAVSQQYDKSSIYETCQKLKDHNYKGIVIIKSTLEPQTCQKLANTYQLNIVHNPEFLSAKTAVEDYHRQTHIVIGQTSTITQENLNLIEDFFYKYYPLAQFSVCTSDESESMKLFCNSFYAVKIQFFNELFVLCQNLNINYDNVKNLMIKNNWINPMHTQVPGTDGQLSYGGMCFPKDMNALNALMQHNQTPHQVIQSAIKERDLMRNN